LGRGVSSPLGVGSGRILIFFLRFLSSKGKFLCILGVIFAVELNRHELHWLPISECVRFKLACLVHQWLFKQAPPYLADYYCLVSDSTLHSAVRRCSDLHSTMNITFVAARAHLRNSLPVQLSCAIQTFPMNGLNDN